MDKATNLTEADKPAALTNEAPLFAASWDVFYQDGEGLECHLQLRGTSLDDLLELSQDTSMAITAAGGRPSRRMQGATHSSDKPKDNGNVTSDGASTGASDPARDKTYIDERGVRRCNLKLTNGSICGRPVSEKEGRYGTFWSCPNYKNHAPVAAH